MSVDPMTGRNPSYCFVDLASKDLAEHVMEEYNGRDFMRRPLKVKPGEFPKFLEHYFLLQTLARF